MSEQLDNLALFNHLFSTETNHLTFTEKSVAFVIAKHRNVKSFKCCPGLTLLAKEANCNRTTIWRATTKLVEEKEIMRLLIPRSGGRPRSQYYFMFDIQIALEIFQNDESILNLHYPDEVENFEWCLAKKLF